MLSMQMIFSIIGAAVGIIIAIIIFGQIAANIECPQDTITPTENNLEFDLSTADASSYYVVTKKGTNNDATPNWCDYQTTCEVGDFIKCGDQADLCWNDNAGETGENTLCTTQSGVKSCVPEVDPRPMTDPHWLEGLLGEGKGYEACTQAKQTAWTILGILPVVLFFALFTIFGKFGKSE